MGFINNDTIKIGLMAPLTGLVKLYGQEISIAAQIACDEINERGGLLGKKLELIIEDDGSLPETAVPAAIKLVKRHKCTAIIGNLLSNARIAVANQVADPLKIPMLNFSFYEGSIYNRYYFSFSALPNQQIDKMIPYMVKKFGPKFYFAGSNYEWPMGSIDAGKRALINAGGEVVGEEYLPIGHTNYTDLLNQLERSGADVFVPYFAGQDQVNLLNEFTSRGLKNKMAVVMGHYDEAMVGSLSPEVREGFYSSNTYFMSIDNEMNRKYLNKLEAIPEVNGLWPRGNGVLTNFGEGAYVCMMAFAQAVKRAGSVETNDIINALELTDIEAPQGRVIMDPETHHATVNANLARCELDGRFTIIKQFGQIRPVIPERYIAEFNSIKSKNAAVNISIANKQDNNFYRNNRTGIARVALNGRFQYANILFGELVNTSVEDLINTSTLPNLVSKHSSIDAISALSKILAKESDSEKIMIRKNPEDTHFSHELEITGIPDTRGVIEGFLVKARNGSSGQNGTQNISWIHPYYTAYCIFDSSGNINYISSGLLKRTGYNDKAEFGNKHISDLISDTAFTINPETNLGKQLVLQFSGKNGNILLPARLESNLHNSEHNFILMIQNEPADNSRKILSKADIVIIAVNPDGMIVEANEYSSKIFGYTTDELISRSIHLLLPPRFREKHKEYLLGFLESDYNELPMGRRGEIFGYRKDGSEFPAQASIAKIESDNGPLLVVSLRDVSERKEAEKRLIWQATHDPLTNLPNRSLLKDRMANALARSERTGRQIAVFFIDLDNFKLINDNYGHEAGDSLLLTVADRLVNAIRPGDTVARFGGDEFVILCEQLDTEEQIRSFITRIFSFLKKPVEQNGHNIYITVSIGISQGSGTNTDAENLLKKADAAMYSAKEEGKDNWKIFNEDIYSKAAAHLSIANGLRTAISSNELQIRLQPIVDAKTAKIVGCETLLRWFPSDTPVSPAEFIPIAESTGIIVPIGQWVFEQACILQAQIGKLMPASPYISVNLSARQLNEPDLLKQFKNIIHETGANPEYILLEITESALIDDVDSKRELILEFGRLGMKIAIDDFGTGYSSLGQLVKMPVDSLKIDKVFIDNIGKKPGADSVVSAIIQMAHSLDMKVIAEGVEVIEQLDFLNKNKCNNIQGYYFYQPLEQEKFLELLKI